MKALIIETAFPGDAVVSLALAAELKRLRPDASITYLVRPDAKELVAASPDVDSVLIFDKRGEESGFSGIQKKAQELNEQKFCVLFLLHNSHRSKSLAKLITATSRIGFESKGSSKFLTFSVADKIKQRTARAISLLDPLFENINYATLPALKVDNYPLLFRETPNHIVAIAPGSVWQTKKWGNEKFVQLTTKLVEQGIGVAIIGGPSDALDLPAAYKDHPLIIDLIGKTSLREAASVIQSTNLLVANDSAPTHLATAVRRKSITIFGPTVPEFGFAQPEALGSIIQLEGLWCRPCTPHGSDVCPIHTHECMKNISVEGVLSEATEILKRSQISSSPVPNT